MSTFNKRYGPEGSQAWLQEIEMNFRVMTCTDAHKVLFGMHTISEEVEYWWENTRQRMEAANAGITWANLKNEFLESIFQLMFIATKR